MRSTGLIRHDGLLNLRHGHHGIHPMSTDEPKSKIIVDEDWKSKVQAEKEHAREAAPQEPAKTGPAAETDMPLPPATFSMLVTTLATQALAALGQFHEPGEEPPKRQPSLAKHIIDTLGVLEEKTKGNLTPDEQAILSRIQHDLRMVFLSTAK